MRITPTTGSCYWRRRWAGGWSRAVPAFSDPDPALWLARDIAHWREHGFGPWVVRERHSKRFIGRAGLGYSTVHRDTVVEVAWAILPSLWGNGLASESASRALALAEELGLGEVVSFTLPANIASRRVMEKIGLQFDCQIQRAGIPHVLYRSGAHLHRGCDRDARRPRRAAP